MTDTPVPDVRELALQAIRDLCPGEGACVADEEECFRLHPVHDAGTVDGVIVSVIGDVTALADAVLAAVTPVIRRQERERVAEEIRAHAAKHFPKGNLSSDVEHARWRGRMHLDIAARIAAGPMTLEEAARAFAAAIARSHSTQPTEEETTDG